MQWVRACWRLAGLVGTDRPLSLLMALLVLAESDAEPSRDRLLHDVEESRVGELSKRRKHDRADEKPCTHSGHY